MSTESAVPVRTTAPPRMPVVFIPHGGGPWPFVEMGLDPRERDILTTYLQSVKTVPKVAPRALLVVSAHWEEGVPTMMTSPRPPMFYDYYGFPEASYRIIWPAPGAPWLAPRVRELLAQGGIDSAEDAQRGFDHGAFVPLKLTYPDAEIPTAQLSLQAGLDATRHLAIGAALAPLRDEGVFIIGSGMTFHNLRIFRDARAVPIAETFDAWLRGVMARDVAGRTEGLRRWEEAPMARLTHPREEHLIPLMVVAGAAGTDPAELAFNGTFGDLRLCAFHFGA